jgi:tetratricopeptide (TPR) repeat protein
MRAAEKLAATASRALTRSDMPAAIALLTRSAGLVPERHPLRLELLVELAEAHREVGAFDKSRLALDEAREGIKHVRDRRLAAYADLAGVQLRIHSDPTIRPEEVAAAAEAAASILEDAGRWRWAAQAWFVRALAPWFRAQAGEAERSLQRAIELARRVGAVRTETRALVLLFGALFFGPIPVPDGIRRCEKMLAERRREKRISASAMRALGLLRAMSGDFEEARRLLACDRAIGIELGLLPAVGIASYGRGIVELLAGDPAAAERELRAGHENLRRFGDTCQMAQVAALLAETMYRQGRDAEAIAWCDTSEQEPGVADQEAQRTAKGVRAKVLARQGDVSRAEVLAQEAIALVDETDFPNAQADARFDWPRSSPTATRPRRTSSSGKQSGSTSSRVMR